ncbi:MAG TPA: ester cyclase [Ktedonobacteraceae bacterium]
MSTEDNKTLVRRAIEEEWNQGNFAHVDEQTASNYIHHDPGNPNVRTLEEYKQWAIDSRNAFPDLHLTIEDMVAEGDQVATRWTFRGTNTGDMVTPMYIPATGKQVTGITITRFAGGKLVEDWHQVDMMSFMQQLGLLPAGV